MLNEDILFCWMFLTRSTCVNTVPSLLLRRVPSQLKSAVMLGVFTAAIEASSMARRGERDCLNYSMGGLVTGVASAVTAASTTGNHSMKSFVRRVGLFAVYGTVYGLAQEIFFGPDQHGNADNSIFQQFKYLLKIDDRNE